MGLNVDFSIVIEYDKYTLETMRRSTALPNAVQLWRNLRLEEGFSFPLVVVALVELHEDSRHNNSILVCAWVERPDVVVIGLVEQKVDRHWILNLEKLSKQYFKHNCSLLDHFQKNSENKYHQQFERVQNGCVAIVGVVVSCTVTGFVGL